MVITLPRVALLVVLTLSTIVGCGPSVPPEIVYALSVPGGARHADSRVLRDGAPIGTLADRVLVRVPSSVQPGDLNLTVETELPIRVGDEALGAWRPADGTTLVAVRAGCYAWRSIGYGTAAGADAQQLDLRTDRVHALAHGVPEYLFAAAPPSVWSSASGEVHSELQRVACP